MTLPEFLSRRAHRAAAVGRLVVPEVFSSLAEEWSALDGACALGYLGPRAVLEAKGRDARRFLHGQTSADVASLASGQGAPALLLTLQGRLVARVDLYGHRADGSAAAAPQQGGARGPAGFHAAPDSGHDWFELRLDGALLEGARERLERFIVADDVRLDVRHGRTTLVLSGPDAPELLARLGSPEAPCGWSVSHLEVEGERASVFGRGELRVPLYELEVPADAAVRWWQRLEEAGARPAGYRAFETVRVESGVASVPVDADGSTMALEARLEWAIASGKGCYVGQEVIERAVSRGRLRRRLALLAASRPVAAGARLASAGTGGSAGREERGDEGARFSVTSAVDSPALGPLCLAYVPAELDRPGAAVTLEQPGGGLIDAEVLPWPRKAKRQ